MIVAGTDFDGFKGIPPDEGTFAVAGFVLAGGRSSRMGKDKALLTLAGEFLVVRALRKLRYVCSDVGIAGGAEELRCFGRVIPDEHPGSGPLGGIVAALGASSFEWNLFLAVDAPFVPVPVLKTLLSMISGLPCVCVMARTQGVMQPLCALYSKKALEVLRKELVGGRWKVIKAIEAAGRVEIVDFENSAWFANLNTPQEFAEAEDHIDMLDV